MTPPAFDLALAPSPCYVIDLDRLRANAELFARVRRDSGAKVLLALKGFAAFSTFDVLRPHLDGTCASGPYEARLGAERFGGEVHVYSPAFTEASLRASLAHATSISFNSPAQHERFRTLLDAERPELPRGLRVNPEASAAPDAKYDPCGPCSRLGTRAADLGGAELGAISGLSLHALCEAEAADLERVLESFAARFGPLLADVEWVNFGGGHMATRPGYDIGLLCRLVSEFKVAHGVEVFLEPGEAVAYDAGHLVATVIDVVPGDPPAAVLDASAAAHAPDVIEFPYQPEVIGASRDPGSMAHAYALGGPSCLAGDVFGNYGFAAPLKAGDRVAFGDMAHYSMVKNNTFNGIPLPPIALWSAEGGLRVVREFGYADFEGRLS